MRYQYTTNRLELKIMAIPSVDEDVAQLKLWYISGSVKLILSLCKTVWYKHKQTLPYDSEILINTQRVEHISSCRIVCEYLQQHFW